MVEAELRLTNIKTSVQRTINRFGYELHRVKQPPVPGQLRYEEITPTATYAPWRVDDNFMAAYQAVFEHTLVDMYRCYELWTLVEQSRKTPGAILEVGVWRGGTGALLARKAQLCGISEKVYLCDTFNGVIKAGPEDTFYKGGEHADTSRQTVVELLTEMDLDNVEILTGIFPDETGTALSNEIFRLCHIDADVYRSVSDTSEWVWDRMSNGGVIVYDDYGFQTCEGVTKYVNEQMLRPSRLVLHNLNGHAIIIKIA